MTCVLRLACYFDALLIDTLSEYLRSLYSLLPWLPAVENAPFNVQDLSDNKSQPVAKIRRNQRPSKYGLWGQKHGPIP